MPQESPISVLIADDDQRMVDTLTALIESRPFLRLAGVGGDATEAVAIATQVRPCVALLDVRMPGGGASTARSIRAASPRTRCVALSAYCDLDSLAAMREAGVVDYLLKGRASVADIVRAIRRAAGQDGDRPT